MRSRRPRVIGINRCRHVYYKNDFEQRRYRLIETINKTWHVYEKRGQRIREKNAFPLLIGDALLFGKEVVVTGPTSIKALIKSLQMRSKYTEDKKEAEEECQSEEEEEKECNTQSDIESDIEWS